MLYIEVHAAAALLAILLNSCHSCCFQYQTMNVHSSRSVTPSHYTFMQPVCAIVVTRKEDGNRYPSSFLLVNHIKLCTHGLAISS